MRKALAALAIVGGGAEGQRGKHEEILIEPRLPARLVPKAPQSGEEDENQHRQAWPALKAFNGVAGESRVSSESGTQGMCPYIGLNRNDFLKDLLQAHCHRFTE